MTKVRFTLSRGRRGGKKSKTSKRKTRKQSPSPLPNSVLFGGKKRKTRKTRKTYKKRSRN
jgi:hypothetical protein